MILPDISSYARIAGGVALLIALGAAGWWHHHRYMLRADHEAYVDNIEKLGNSAKLKAAEAEIKVKNDLNEVQANYTRDTATLRTRADALNRQLQNRPSRSDVPKVAAAGCTNHAAKGSELYREDGGFLKGESTRADEVTLDLIACQATVKSYLEAMK